jgi:hypothetical protein
MNTTPTPRTSAQEMERIVEPLASFLCATEHPEIALKSALAALYSQIEQTNRTANQQISAFVGRRLALSP